MKALTHTLVCLLIISAASVASAAQKMYKWVDEQGNVTYQDRPPPTGVQVLEEYQEPNAATEEEKATVAVTLYSVPICDACDLVRSILQKNGIPFTEKNAEQNAEVQKEIKDRAGQLGVPTLFIGERTLIGYNSVALRDELTAAGFKLEDNAVASEPAEAQPESPAEADIAGEVEPLPDEPEIIPPEERLGPSRTY